LQRSCVIDGKMSLGTSSIQHYVGGYVYNPKYNNARIVRHLSFTLRMVDRDWLSSVMWKLDVTSFTLLCCWTTIVTSSCDCVPFIINLISRRRSITNFFHDVGGSEARVVSTFRKGRRWQINN